MTNAALQAILEEYGEKVKCIKCTGCMVVLNQKFINNTFTKDDIEFKDFGGVDCFTYKDQNPMSGNYNTIVVPTADVIKVITTENDKDKLDPYRI